MCDLLSGLTVAQWRDAFRAGGYDMATGDRFIARIKEKIAQGQALGEQYSALWQEVAWLHAKWGEYVELFGTKSSRVDLLNEAAPYFFGQLQYTLWSAIGDSQ